MREEGRAMTRNLITFPSDAMNHIPSEPTYQSGTILV
jgi:hypothetical protein